MAITTLVSPMYKNIWIASDYIQTKQKSSTFLQQRTTPNLGPTFPGGRYIIKQAYRLKGIPTESIKISLASLNTSSMRQYNSALKKWWQFCHLTNTNIYLAGIPDILRFLTNEYKDGASYGTINCLRSAVALIIGSEVGPEVGQNTSIKRFCKGISKLRPMRPKYDTTWDPKIVLDFFSKQFSNKEVPLEKLGEKVATLMALTTGHRLQTLSLIDIRNIEKVNKNIEIKIPAQLKTSGYKKVQPILILPFYTQDPTICVASALTTYIHRIKNLWKEENRLFISGKKPHKAVGTQSLSRWIKKTLQISGVDTNIFSAYSTRHASTSAAKRSGMNIDQIKKTAGWSSSSQTFAKFYERKISERNDLFAKAILNLQNNK